MFNSNDTAAQNEKTEIKRFVAPTMARALKLVSEEMGPEAVILSSQRVPEGIEVITSLEPDLPTRGIDVRRQFGQNFDAELDQPMQSDNAWKMQAGINQAAAQYKRRDEKPNSHALQKDDHLAREIDRARENMLAAKKDNLQARPTQKPSFHEFVKQQSQSASDAVSQRDRRDDSFTQSGANQRVTQQASEDVQFENLKQELADMRLLLEQQLWHMNESKHQSRPSQVKLPPEYNVVGEHLKRLGLNDQLIDYLQKDQNPNLRPNASWKQSLAKLAKTIPVYGNDITQSGGVFAFVGPTGVGKTTTIAKLAAQYVMTNGPGKVAILTTDTYRVGAHEQLKNLGRILDVPVKAVDDENTLPVLLAGLKRFPLVLIDTAGFRQGDPLLKDQLRALDSCPYIKRMLVMACNSQHQTMRASTHGYAGKYGLNACVISKLDEAYSLGEALSVSVEKSLPVAYTTDGQEIPNDITLASSGSLVAKAVAMSKAARSESAQIAKH